MEKNIKYNFTANVVNEQPLAVMPASLAQKLLRDMASKLVGVRPVHIMEDFLAELHATKEAYSDDLEKFNAVALNYLNERSLIENVSKENWDAYKVSE